MIHGRNLIVDIDGYAIAAAKSCSLQLSQDFIQTCSPTSGRVRNKIPTTYDWSVSVDCLIANSSLPMNLKDKLIEGTRCFLTFTDGNNERRAGFVYVKSCDESGPVGSLATFSVSFESDGELYKYNRFNTEYDQGTDGCELEDHGGVLVYDFRTGTQDGITLADITVPKKGYLYVPTNDVWAVYVGDSASNISQAFYNEDEQYLRNHYYKHQVGDKLMSIDPDDQHSYNFVVAVNHEEMPVFFLYE